MIKDECVGYIFKKEGFKKVKILLPLEVDIMLVFGVDIPLIEVLLVLAVIIFILLVESLILIGMLISQMNKTKKVLELMQKMADTLLAIKKAEIDELDRLKRK